MISDRRATIQLKNWRSLKLYLLSVEYNPGHMEDAILLHENNPEYSVDELYQFIFAN